MGSAKTIETVGAVFTLTLLLEVVYCALALTFIMALEGGSTMSDQRIFLAKGCIEYGGTPKYSLSQMMDGSFRKDFKDCEI